MKIKNYILAFFFSLSVFSATTTVFCQKAVQDSAKEIDLSSLKPPTSPGFTILDIAPNSIERPKTIREFTVSTTNLFNQGFSIPKNFAFEVAPGWLLNNKGYSFSQITGLIRNQSKTTQNIFSDVKFSSISVASIYNDSSNTQLLQAKTNHIGYGGKLNLIKVYGKKRVDAIDVFLNSVDSTTKKLLEEVDPDEKTKIAEQIRAHTKHSWDQIKDLRSIRPLFQLQIAGAGSHAFPDNKNGRFHRGGGWLTSGFSFPLIKKDTTPYYKRFIENKKFINIVLLGRFISSRFDSVYLDKRQNLVDVGGRIEFELNRLMVGVEYLGRSGNNKFNSTHRFAGMIEYKVYDNLFIVGSFGRNFGEYNNVISLLGLSWGFGKQSIYTPFNMKP